MLNDTVGIHYGLYVGRTLPRRIPPLTYRTADLSGGHSGSNHRQEHRWGAQACLGAAAAVGAFLTHWQPEIAGGSH